jgi:hypothetical protein
VAPIKKMMDWFMDSSMWFSLANELILTPFILLAEDAYWESFVHNKYSSTALVCIVNCLEKTSRMETFWNIIERAYYVSPWNVYIRDELRRKEQEWVSKFLEDHVIISKIQGCMRGYLLRKHWIEISASVVARRQLFLRNLEVANRKHAKFAAGRFRRLLRTWKENAKLLHSYKYENIVILQ